MTALFLEIFVTSTGGLRQDAVNGAKKAGKFTYVVHLGAYIWKKMPRPVKNIHSFFGPCQHTITLQTPTNNDSKPCQFHTKLEEFSFQRQAKCTSQLHPGNIKTKKMLAQTQPKPSAKLQKCRVWLGARYITKTKFYCLQPLPQLWLLVLLGDFWTDPIYISIYLLYVCMQIYIYILCK